MKVLKFGGSSVGSPELIRKTCDIIRSGSEIRAVVFSAYSGVTDELIKMAKLASEKNAQYESVFSSLENIHFSFLEKLIEDKHSVIYISTQKSLEKQFLEIKEILYGVFLIKELSKKSLDYIMSCGERLSCTTISGYLLATGTANSYLDARSIIVTNDDFNNAKVDFEKTNQNITAHFKKHKELQIVTGFTGSTASGETTTLGRGGSDYTVSILGAALKVDEVEIWTDVDGVLTADPRCVQEAFVVDTLSYEEAMELSYFGAKVIYAPTLQPAYEKNIPIRIKNTFNPSVPGSTIASNSVNRKYGITGIASIENIAVLRVEGSGMVGISGVVSRLLLTLSKNQINLILITQSSSEHTICFAVKQDDADLAKKVIEKEFELEIESHRITDIHIDRNLSIVSVVGENMRHTTGVSGKIFGALGKYRINIVAIAQGSSELNVSFVIGQKDLTKALNVIHDEFFFAYRRKAHIYVIGATGNVGSHLLNIIKNFEREDIEITVCGATNSKQMCYNYAGINTDAMPFDIKSDLDEFIHIAKNDRHPLKIMVDCSASEVVTSKYRSILSNGLHLAVANKIANSINMQYYHDIRTDAMNSNVKFRYETNVGASLPVIKTLQNFVKTNDDVLKIEAVLSGSVNYILTKVHEGMKAEDAINEARTLGYTEPNPAEDLSGLDVARKILILARELGTNLNLEDLEITSLIKGNPLKVDLTNCELLDIDALSTAAKNAGKKLKLVAVYENGKAFVRLEELTPDNPLYIIDGANNAIRFFTKRYSKYPLVISGQGAGGELTASGILDDILSIIN